MKRLAASWFIGGLLAFAVAISVKIVLVYVVGMTIESVSKITVPLSGLLGVVLAVWVMGWETWDRKGWE